MDRSHWEDSSTGAPPPNLVDVAVPDGCCPGMEFTVEFEEVSAVGERLPDADPRTLVKIIDITGREVRNPAHQMVFRLYSDGTTEKVIVGDRN